MMNLFVAVALISLGIQTEALYPGLFQSCLYGAGLGGAGLYGGSLSPLGSFSSLGGIGYLGGLSPFGGLGNPLSSLGYPGLLGGQGGKFPGDLRLITEPTSGLPVSEAVYVGLERQRLVPAPYRVPRPAPVPVPHVVPQPFTVDVPIPQPFEVPVPQPVPIHTLTEVTDTALIEPVTTAYVTEHGPMINQFQTQVPFMVY
ncbi:uncharacterized protein LOC119163049 isoform X2 [Rhipicephalus microplus]